MHPTRSGSRSGWHRTAIVYMCRFHVFQGIVDTCMKIESMKIESTKSGAW